MAYPKRRFRDKSIKIGFVRYTDPRLLAIGGKKRMDL
jgi:hypothetical protein